MLSVRGIDVAYGHIQALYEVSIDVPDGETVALVGANGAGKTTTLRAISGLAPPHRGHISLDDQRIERLRPEAIAARGIAHLPEGRGIFPSLSVEENLRMGFWTKRRSRAAYRHACDRIVTLFPRLGERWDQIAGTLSGGEQQMLALSRALLPEPRLLMIDELSLGLAPRVVQDLYRALGEINRSGTTVLLVEQYVSLAFKLAHRAYVLEKGRIAMQGTPEEIMRGGDAMRSMYLGGSTSDAASKKMPRARERAAGTGATEEVTRRGRRTASRA